MGWLQQFPNPTHFPQPLCRALSMPQGEFNWFRNINWSVQTSPWALQCETETSPGILQCSKQETQEMLHKPQWWWELQKTFLSNSSSLMSVQKLTEVCSNSPFFPHFISDSEIAIPQTSYASHTMHKIFSQNNSFSSPFSDWKCRQFKNSSCTWIYSSTVNPPAGKTAFGIT